MLGDHWKNLKEQQVGRCDLPTRQERPMQLVWQHSSALQVSCSTAIAAGDYAAPIAQEESAAAAAARRRTIGADTHTQHIISHL